MYHIYTDGSSNLHTSVGGIGVVVVKKQTIQFCICESYCEIEGVTLTPTNNRMELLAVITALKEAYKVPIIPANIHIYTDSNYVLLGITQWIKRWKLKNYVRVLNPDLWKELDGLAKGVSFHKVKAHSTDQYNNLADTLSKLAYQ